MNLILHNEVTRQIIQHLIHLLFTLRQILLQDSKWLCYMPDTFKVKSLANTNVNSKWKVLRPTDKNHDFVNSKLIYRTNFYSLISSLPNF